MKKKSPFLLTTISLSIFLFVAFALYAKKSIAYKTIISKNSKKCLEVARASKSNLANIIQGDCHGGSNQLWTVIPQKPRPGKRLIVAIKSKNSGKCLDVYHSRKRNGTNIVQYKCHYGKNQLWEVIRKKGPKRVALLKSLHSNKCLDVNGISKKNGANVHLWDCWNGANQLWYVR